MTSYEPAAKHVRRGYPSHTGANPMAALHTMKFHDITHTLESVGYRLNPDGNGYTVSEPDPRKIIDTLRLTQEFLVYQDGVFFTLKFRGFQSIYIDADLKGTRIHEPEHN